jgi:ribosomal protein S14
VLNRCNSLKPGFYAVFKYVPGSHQSPAPTQFGRAMAELGVEQIFARSPEAKGRVERANGTFQDRLVTELRLAGARTISEANQVLWAFLTRFNKRFGVPPAQSTNAYRSPDPDLNLAGILCFKHSRKVARDNTVKYNWHTLQLLPSSERSTYVGAHVVVQERLDGKLVVCYQNQIVPTQEAPPRPGVLRTLNATRGLGSVTVENLAAGMDTNGIGGHEREGLGAMTAIGRGLAAGRLTTDRESEAVHPKAQPPRPPTPRQRARWKAVQRAKRRGLSLRAIARELGISRITVRKYVEASSPPVYPDRELAAHS